MLAKMATPNSSLSHLLSGSASGPSGYIIMPSNPYEKFGFRCGPFGVMPRRHFVNCAGKE